MRILATLSPRIYVVCTMFDFFVAVYYTYSLSFVCCCIVLLSLWYGWSESLLLFSVCLTWSCQNEIIYVLLVYLMSKQESEREREWKINLTQWPEMQRFAILVYMRVQRIKYWENHSIIYLNRWDYDSKFYYVIAFYILIKNKAWSWM